MVGNLAYGPQFASLWAPEWTKEMPGDWGADPGTAGEKKRAVLGEGVSLQPCAAAWEQVGDRQTDLTKFMVLPGEHND